MMKVKNRKGSPGSLLKFIFLFFGIAMSISCMRDGESGYRIMKGQFRQSVIESGELQAVNASFLTMPRISYVYGYRFKVVGLAEHGKTVKKGEEVVRVDPASIQKYIIERQESLENEIAASNKLRAQVTNNLQELRAQLRSEQASYDLKKLQYEKSGFEADAIKKVIELEFRQSEIRLTKTKRALAVRPGLDSLDIRIQQIKVEQKRDELEAAEETLERLVVRSPLDGVFVVEKNWSTGQTIKVGDEVFLGMPVARIPDIRTMKVEGFVYENDISHIKSGLDVIVRLDALPNVPFHGKVSSVSKVCIPREDKKIFRTEVLISESDIRLKPGMTVSCEYITWESDNTVFVPNSCILEENRHFYIFARRRGRLIKTEVRPGPSNNAFTVVDTELRPGVVLQLPENVETKQ